MKGWILTTPDMVSKLPFSPEVAAAMGLEIVDVTKVEILIDNCCDGTIMVDGVKHEIPDFVLSAFVKSHSYRPTAVLRQMESLGVVCINDSGMIAISKDKIYTSQVLAAHGVPIVKTLLLEGGEECIERVEQLFSYPFVVKVIDGTQGSGVYLVHSREELEGVVSEQGGSDLLIQEYVASSFGRDIRVTAFSGEVIKVVGRQSAGDDFRSNISLGGSETELLVDSEMVALARNIYKATGIEICGIDLLYGPEGYLVCEINSMPGGLNTTSLYNPLEKIMKGIARKVIKKPMPRWRVDMLLRASAERPLHAQIMALGALDRSKAVVAMASDAERVQQSVLASIISCGRDALYGREHGFDKITDVASFAASQPITEWADYESYIDRMALGERDLLFMGETDSFITTSGTTAKPKLIPESGYGKMAKGLVSMSRFDMVVRREPSLARSGAILPVVLPSVSGATEGGIKCAYASGMALGQLPAKMQERIAFPADILRVKSGELYSYLVMRYAIERGDLAVIAGNNALRMVNLITMAEEFQEMIISDFERGDISFETEGEDRELVEVLKTTLVTNSERASVLRSGVESGERFTPSLYWPDLKVVTFWTSASVGLSMPELMPLLPSGVKVMDTGYGASELKVNIPVEPGAKDGLLSLATAFYEFLPLDSDDGKTLLASELEVGCEYEIIVTTYGGLYRYNIHDVVRCTGYMGTTPSLIFVRKSGDIRNISGDKLPAAALLEAVSGLSKECDISLVRFQAMADYSQRRYRLFIECAEGGDRGRFMAKINDRIAASHWSYNAHTVKGLLAPVAVQFMREGWQNHLYEQKRAGRDISESQIKLPIFIDESPEQCWYE